MYTQCPACHTIFEIDEDALQASFGIVRCGHCEQRFDALRSLSNSLPTEPDAALPLQDPESLTPTLTEAVTAEAIASAARKRKRKSSSAAAEPVAGWLTPAADATRALLADAAGIPHEALQGDADWQVTDVAESSASGELDSIPVADDVAASAPDDATPSVLPESNPPAQSDVPTVAESTTTGAGATPDHTGVITVVEADAAATPTAEMLRDAPVAPLIEPATDAVASITDGAPPDDAADSAAPTIDKAAANAPVYVPPRQRRIHPHDGWWALGCLLLLVTLAGELAWANRASLMRDPSTQATMLDVCARIRCDLPPIRDIAQLELLSRDIRPDPKAAGALLITATVRNNARFAQPWPVVVVQLNDIDNTPVAMRRFRPAEYLPDAGRRAAGLAPGTTAAVAFEVADPGPRAVAFHFSFD